MNIEDYREYCLSLGNDIEEKLPFQKFKNREGVDDLLKELTRNSFEIVKIKYASKREQKQTRLDSAEREHIQPKVKYTKTKKI